MKGLNPFIQRYRSFSCWSQIHTGHTLLRDRLHADFPIDYRRSSLFPGVRAAMRLDLVLVVLLQVGTGVSQRQVAP